MRKTTILIGAALGLAHGQAAKPIPLDELLAKAANWNVGQSRESMRAISEAVRKAQASAVEKREVEKRLALFLESKATLASKDFVCRELSVIGSDASAPVLSGMLARAETSDMARFALERIPDAGADRALREALGKTSGRTRIGIIDSLGRRRDGASVAALRSLATSMDAPAAAAALSALAEIADAPAMKAIEHVYSSSVLGAQRAAAEAWLKAAGNLVERGNKGAALAVYKRLYVASEQPMIRIGALNGIIAADPKPLPVLLDTLRGEDSRLQALAIDALAKTSPKQLLAEMRNLPEGGRVRVLAAMSERREKSALPEVLAALKDPSKPVRLAALQGIGAIGDASAIATLAGIAAGSDEAERAAARASLAAIPGNAVDRRIVEEMAGAAPAVRQELIRAAGARGTTEAAPVLLKMASEGDGEVRRESLRALRETASSGEVAGLAALVTAPANPAEREEAARGLSAALRRSDGSRAQEVVAAYSAATDPAARAALLQTLGPSGHTQALPILRAALKEENADVKRAAILALTEWPDGSPVAELIETAGSAANPAHQVLALRGAIKLIGLASPARPPQESVELLAGVMSLAKQAEEKRAVLAQLPKYSTPEALDLARASLNDPQVSAEAKTAAARLANALGR